MLDCAGLHPQPTSRIRVDLRLAHFRVAAAREHHDRRVLVGEQLHARVDTLPAVVSGEIVAGGPAADADDRVAGYRGRGDVQPAVDPERKTGDQPDTDEEGRGARQEENGSGRSPEPRGRATPVHGSRGPDEKAARNEKPRGPIAMITEPSTSFDRMATAYRTMA